MTNPIYDTYKPPGFHTMNVYMSASNPKALIDFLKAAFYAKKLERTIDDSNQQIRNCIFQMGDSCFMVSQSPFSEQAMPGQYYLFVENPDIMVERASHCAQGITRHES